MKKVIGAIIFIGLAAVLIAAAILIPNQTDGQTDTEQSSSRGELDAAASVTRDELPSVRLTVTGVSFMPVLELADSSDAVVKWTVEETGASCEGLSPALVFDAPAVRHIELTAAYTDGTDALGDIITFNVGFDHTQDAGRYNVGGAYDHPVQTVAGLDGVYHMTGLIRFLAATPSLSGFLDFSGLNTLEYIECYGASVSSIDLTGCEHLVRLCLELNDLDEIDLNPVSGCLRDLRMSGNQSVVTFVPLTSPMASLYHYCAQSEAVVNHPTAEQLPVIEEWWDWASDQSGELVIRSKALSSVITSWNAWTSADFTNQFPAGRNGSVEAHGCLLKSVELAGCSGLTHLDLYDNLLDQNAVDAILAEASSWGTYGGTLDLSQNTPPSASAGPYIAELEARNWSVTVEPAA